MIKFAQIYYLGDRMLISAIAQTTDGMTPNALPASLLLTPWVAEAVGEATLASLCAFERGVSLSAGEHGMRAVLEISAEPSWDTISANWDLISVEQRDAKIVLYPMRKYRRGGHVSFGGDPTYECHAGASEVGNKIMEIIRARITKS